MAKYRKKPVVIEAFQWLNKQWVVPDDHWLIKAQDRKEIRLAGDILLIKTPEGEMQAKPGDWIIRGVKGEIYPCKPDIFEATYEAVEEA